MFGPRQIKNFASWWDALWWAAANLLIAWRRVPEPDDDDASAFPVARADARSPWGVSTPGRGRR